MAACCRLVAHTTLIGLVGLVGCGSPQRAASTHARFAALQVEEARLERALLAAAHPTCTIAEPAARDAGGAAVAACTIADAARDPDAHARCARARGRALDARAQVEARCAESAAAPPETTTP